MSDITLPVTGGCLCGAIRYESSEPPTDGSLCHCRVCQKTTGSAFAPVTAFPLTAFRFTKGKPKLYKSSSIMEKSFCSDCGSPLIAKYLVTISEELHSDSAWVHIGTLDEPEIAPINDHYGVESQLSWARFNDGLPRMRCDKDPEMVAARVAAEAGDA